MAQSQHPRVGAHLDQHAGRLSPVSNTLDQGNAGAWPSCNTPEWGTAGAWPRVEDGRGRSGGGVGCSRERSPSGGNT